MLCGTTMLLAMDGLVTRGDNARRYQLCVAFTHHHVVVARWCLWRDWSGLRPGQKQPGELCIHIIGKCLRLYIISSYLKPNNLTLNESNELHNWRIECDFVACHADPEVCPFGGVAFWLFYTFQITLNTSHLWMFHCWHMLLCYCFWSCCLFHSIWSTPVLVSCHGPCSLEASWPGFRWCWHIVCWFIANWFPWHVSRQPSVPRLSSHVPWPLCQGEACRLLYGLLHSHVRVNPPGLDRLPLLRYAVSS